MKAREPESAGEKAIAILREMAGDRALQLGVAIPEAQATAREALKERFGAKQASEIAFHLTDWNSDAAFLVALLLCPERFTPEEVQEGVQRFLLHVPNHVAAAAKLHGHPVEDVFEVGALDPEDQG